MDEFSEFLGIVRAYRDANEEMGSDKVSVVNGMVNIEEGNDEVEEGEEEAGLEGKRSRFSREECDNERGKRGSILTVYRRQRRKPARSRNCRSRGLSTEEDTTKQSEGLNEKRVDFHKEIKNESSEQVSGEVEGVISGNKNAAVVHLEVDMKVKKDVEGDGVVAVGKSDAFNQSYLREYWSNKKNPDMIELPDVVTRSGKEHESGGGYKCEIHNKKEKKRKIVKGECDKVEVFPSRSAQKKHLRMKIMDMLLVAGWRIEYRPRGGKEYNDAVYISPQGRGLWSVTLAYKFLKEHHEAMGDSGSGFTPVPEEELKILERITKKRKEREMGLHGKKRVKEPKQKQMKKNKYNKSVKIRKLKNYGDRKRKNFLLGFESESDEQPKKRGRGRPRKTDDDYTDLTIKEPHKSVMRNRSSQKHQSRRRCSLIARSSNEGFDSKLQNYAHYPGKRCVLAWMIEMGSVPLNGKVHCMNEKSQIMFRGVIMDDGICCDCCNREFSVSNFAIHAGSDAILASQNIYLESGESLLQCQLYSWNKQDESCGNGFRFIDLDMDDPNDDTCNLCGDGGDLVCCDSCPSTFHQSCLGMQEFPSGAWHCIYCSCKFCGLICENFNETDNDTSTKAVICGLCEEKYHLSCSPLNNNECDESCYRFCSKVCKMIFENLQKLFGVKHELEDGFSWTIIHQSDVRFDSCLTETPQKVESNAKIAVTFSLMNECFLPIIDERSGINLIHNIVYNRGSNFSRLNYTGFVTVILERDDELVSAASVRIHGSELAEMPFIGTRHIFRRQGFCRRLLHVVEIALASLEIKKLVIPAVHELLDTWTNVFGFKPLDAIIQEKMKHMNMLVFPCTDMLQKSLVKKSFSQDEMIVSTDAISAEVGNFVVLDSKEDVVPPKLEGNDGSIYGDSKSNSVHGLLSDKCSTDTSPILYNVADVQFNEGQLLPTGTEVVNPGKDWCNSTEDNHFLNQSTILCTSLSRCSNIASLDPDKNDRFGGDDLTSHEEEMDACQTNISELISTSPRIVSEFVNNENHVGICNIISNIVDTVPDICKLPTVDMDIVELESIIHTVDEGCLGGDHSKDHEEIMVSVDMDFFTYDGMDGGNVCSEKETGDQICVATSGVKIPANDTQYSSTSVEESSVGGSHERITAPFVLEACVDTARACSGENNNPIFKSASLLNNILYHSEDVPPDVETYQIHEEHEIGSDHVMEICVCKGTCSPDRCSDENIIPVCASTSGFNGLSDDVEIVLQTVGEGDHDGDFVRGIQHLVSDFDVLAGDPSSYSEEDNGKLSVTRSEDKCGFDNDNEAGNTPSTVQVCTLEGTGAGLVSCSEGNSDRFCTSTSGLNHPCYTEIVLPSTEAEYHHSHGNEGSSIHQVTSSCCSDENTDRVCGVTSNIVFESCKVETDICDMDKKESLLENNDFFCGTTSGFDDGQPCDQDATVHVNNTSDFISEDDDETTSTQIIKLSSSDTTDTMPNFCRVESGDENLSGLNNSTDIETVLDASKVEFIEEDNVGSAIPPVIDVCTSEEMNEEFDCCAENDKGHDCEGISKLSRDAETVVLENNDIGEIANMYNENILLNSEGMGANIPLSNQNFTDRSMHNGSIIVCRGQFQVDEIPEDEPDKSFSSGEKRPILVDMLTENSNSVVFSAPSNDVVNNVVESQFGSCSKSENTQSCAILVSPVSTGPDVSDPGGRLVEEVVI